ncbi:MAG: alcohol dehydrogenase catalytic domain-containing protein [Planctomycetes bacterium]|nr:alcohol dehydrogenase catalytic domain-containing protein [Planctomycetota bacterium]
MLAVRKTSKFKGLTLCEIDEPVPLEDEVLIKVTSASICGSDLYIYNWDGWAPERIHTPLTIGHEISGVVADRGGSVRSISTGDKVALESHIFCEQCHSCKEDKRHICESLKIVGIDVDGGFASYIKIPAKCCWKLPAQIDVKSASLMEPFGNAVHATENLELKDKNVFVMGCGPIGIFTIQLLKYFGAAQIWATDTAEARLKSAFENGATHVFNPIKDDLIAVSKNRHMSFDFIFEMSGSDQALKQATKLAKNAGTIITFGLQKAPVAIDITDDIIMKEVTIKGIVGRHLFKTWDKMTQILSTGKISFDKSITHRLSIKNFDEGFKVLMSKDKNALKIVLMLE